MAESEEKATRDYVLSEFRRLLARGEHIQQKMGGADIVANTYIAAGVQYGMQHGGDHWAGVVTHLREIADYIESRKEHSAAQVMSTFAALGVKQLKTMKSGRAAGVAARQKEKARKVAALVAEITPLVAKGWKNEAITADLMERKVSPYSRKSTETHVTSIAARLRKARP
jgi:hypothetical protein